MTDIIEKQNPDEANKAASYREPDKGFSLKFSKGRGIISGSDIPFETVIKMTARNLELKIKKISFPFDVSNGVDGLRNKLHELKSLTVKIKKDEVAEFIAQNAEKSNFIKTSKICFEKDHISVFSEYEKDGESCRLTFRLVPCIVGNTPVLIIHRPCAYGPTSQNLLLTSHDVFTELTGKKCNSPTIEFLSFLKETLKNIFIHRGWRLPEADNIILSDFSLFPDRIVLKFTKLTHDGMSLSNLSTLGTPDNIISFADKLGEENRKAKNGDFLLKSNNFKKIRKQFAGLLAEDPENPVITYRLALLDVTSADYRAHAISSALNMLEKNPERLEFLSILIAAAANSQNEKLELKALMELARNADSQEYAQIATRIYFLSKTDDPKAAASYLLQACQLNKDNKHLMLLLLEMYGKAKDKRNFLKLLPKWLVLHKEPTRKALAHKKAALILLDDLDDAKNAVSHFDKAAILDPSLPGTIEGLAKALSTSGDTSRALMYLKTHEQRCQTKEDKESAANINFQTGSIWLKNNEPLLALDRFRTAYALKPSLLYHLKIAQVLALCNRYAEAVIELEAALGNSDFLSNDPNWGIAAYELGLLYFETDEYVMARKWLEKAENFKNQSTPARNLLVKIYDKTNKKEKALALLLTLLKETFTLENALYLSQMVIKYPDTYDKVKNVIQKAKLLFSDNIELADGYIEILKNNKEWTDLHNAYVERLQTTASKEKRADISCEIALIELDHFKNPEAAKRWLITANEYFPSSQKVIKGLEELEAILNPSIYPKIPRRPSSLEELFETVRVEEEIE